MSNVEKLDVYLSNRLVGTLALLRDKNVCAFEYSDKWIETGYSISPFSLPLETGVFVPRLDPLNGLYGVFDDSLPDGWGRLLVDRLMLKRGIDPFSLGNLDRLAIVADSGMGALEYRPANTLLQEVNELSLDEIAVECKKLLETEYSDALDILFKKGGSPGGARPKILTRIDEDDWLIKFNAKDDSDDSGLREYQYAKCAVECGIEFPEFKLFESNICDGYFGVKRFDRVESTKVHMITAAGLLETSHRLPNLDYNILMKLTYMLTGDMSECKKLFRRMCFNVFSHNRDDHSKNFSYLYLEEEGRWILSPAYDLTYSNSIGGEHATTVNGNGKNPGRSDLLAVAKNIGLTNVENIVDDIRECVEESLNVVS